MTHPLPVRAFKLELPFAALCRMFLAAALFWAHGAIAQSQAQADINTALAGFAATINAHAAAHDLDYTHLLPYFDGNYRNDGNGVNAGAADLADGLRGGSVASLLVNGVVSLATDAGGNSIASTTGALAANTAAGPMNLVWNQFSTDFTELTWYYKPAGGSWKIYGNQQPAKIQILTFTENRQSGLACAIGCDGIYYFTWFNAQAPQGRFNAITVNGPGYAGVPLVAFGTQTEQRQASPPPAAPLIFTYDQFVLNGPAVTAFPPVGSTYNFTLASNSGAPQQAARNVRPWTTEAIRVTSPTGHALANANLGGTLTLNWTLPITFTVLNVNVNMVTNSSAGMCNAANSNDLPANATSYTFTSVPTQCLGQPIADGASQGSPLSVVVDVTGTNGEETRAYYAFGTSSCAGVNTPPGNLSASGTTASQVQLQWNRACMPTTIGNYGVYRSTAPGGPFSLVGTTDQNTRFFNDTNVGAGAIYYYYVVATDTTGDVSLPSNQITATTPGSIAAPGFTLPQGIIPPTSVIVQPTGTLSNRTLVVLLKIEDIIAQASAGSFAASGYNVYVAALVPNERLGQPAGAGTWFVKAQTTQGPGWELLSIPIKAFIAGVVASSQLVEIDILSNLNLSGLVGTEIYVGYGTSGDEMIQNRRYRGVFEVQP
jgi:hypothetical protein